MGPREKKKESPAKNQMSIEQFVKPVAKTPQKRRREEDTEKQSPSKKSREVQSGGKPSNNNNVKESAVNNNNNNNNNNNKEKNLSKKEKKGSEPSLPKPLKKEKVQTGTLDGYLIAKKENVNEDTGNNDVALNLMTVDQNAEINDENPDSPGQILSDQDAGEGVFIGPNIISNSEDFRNEEPEEPESSFVNAGDNESDIGIEQETIFIPTEEAKQQSAPSNSASNSVKSKILTPPPPPEPQPNPKQFKCKHCDEWFPNRYYQRKHMLMEHEDQLYECRVCSYNSCDPEKLKSHIIKMHVAKKERTESVSMDEAQLDLNELMTKQTPRKVVMEDGVSLGRDPCSKLRFICAICDRIYTTKYSLERHVRCHTGEKPYTCDVCNFTTSYREHMQRHMTSIHLIVHSDEPKVKSAAKKGKKTEDKCVPEDDPIPTPEPQSLDGSFESNNSSETTTSSGSKKRRNILRKRFECAACGLKATHKTDLRDHIRDKHPNAHIASLENGDGSKVHLIVTTSKKSTSSRRMIITCPNCFMIFHDTWKYKVHMRSHTGVKPFGCSLCEFRATSKMTVRDHVHRKHKDAQNPKILLRTVGIDGTVQHVELSFPQREFKCDVCSESFKDNYHMKQHKKKAHQESLPFSCVECGHREWARASIIIHCLQEHPDNDLEGMVLRNNRPFTVGPHKLPKCDVCEKVFSYQSQLYLHQRQHTGERNFVCDICNYRTNHKPALQKHIEKHLAGPEKETAQKSTQPITFVEVEGEFAGAKVKKEGDKKSAKTKKEGDKRGRKKGNESKGDGPSVSPKKNEDKKKKSQDKKEKETEKAKKSSGKVKENNSTKKMPGKGKNVDVQVIKEKKKIPSTSPKKGDKEAANVEKSTVVEETVK